MRFNAGAIDHGCYRCLGRTASTAATRLATAPSAAHGAAFYPGNHYDPTHYLGLISMTKTNLSDKHNLP